ncbi:MAG: quinol:cytochrome C oxidoreductase [Bacteroidota bacterium]
MGSHHHEHVVLDEQYSVSPQAKSRILLTLVLGIVFFIIGCIGLSQNWFASEDEHGGGHGHVSATHQVGAAHHEGSQPGEGAHVGAATEKHDDAAAADAEHKAEEHAAAADTVVAGHTEGIQKVDGNAPDSHAVESTIEEHPSAVQTGEHSSSSVSTAPAAHHAEAGEHHGYNWMSRVWANLWLGNVFFAGIALIGLFFVCVQYVAWAGWATLIKRIPEAFGFWLPFAGVLMVVLFAFGHHDLFHWTHDYLHQPLLADKTANPQYDEIIVGKEWYLNIPFYLGRMIFFFGAWITVHFIMRKYSLAEDKEAGTSVKWYNKSIFTGAIFLVIFAVSESMSAWDWVMSIDPHWFSTLFGWYMFASWWVSGLSMIALSIIILKEKGYLQSVNINHLHNLGQFMFAFSIFWTYLWTAQFLLIYYANLPEEAIYFIQRRDGFNGQYSWLFYFNVINNFVFPFLFLMTRDAKRHVLFMKIAAIGLIIGHYLDFYLMIMPGVVKEHNGFGFVELGTFMIFASLFAWVVSSAISKAPLVPKNHPMLEESVYHEI